MVNAGQRTGEIEIGCRYNVNGLEVTYYYVRGNGVELLLACSTLIIMGSQVVCFVIFTRRVAHIAPSSMGGIKVIEQREKEVCFDLLSGLPVQFLFHDKFEHALGHAHYCNETLVLFHLDIDRFREVNEQWGYHCGDLLLQKISERLLGRIGCFDVLAGTNGDKFMFVFPVLNSMEEIKVIAQDLLSALSRPFNIDGNRIVLTACLGISQSTSNCDSVEELYRQAELAMRSVKACGGSCYRFFTQDMLDQRIEHYGMINRLTHALRSNDFHLEYQPQLDLKTGRIVGVEALIRWSHPEYGVVSPERFIPIAEKSGLIDGIGEWVISTACKQHVSWRNQVSSPLRVSVNLSCWQVMKSKIVPMVKKILTETGMEPSRLELELTESVFLEDVKCNIETLNELKALGVSLALDDFGKGYSSLDYLKKISFDRLKIDRSFISDVLDEKKNGLIVESILMMGKSLGIPIVAEGVENYNQLEFLYSHKCDEVQGYLIGRPMPASEFSLLLQEGCDSQEQPIEDCRKFLTFESFMQREGVLSH